jgi:hypothetical protein
MDKIGQAVQEIFNFCFGGASTDTGKETLGMPRENRNLSQPGPRVRPP